MPCGLNQDNGEPGSALVLINTEHKALGRGQRQRASLASRTGRNGCQQRAEQNVKPGPAAWRSPAPEPEPCSVTGRVRRIRRASILHAYPRTTKNPHAPKATSMNEDELFCSLALITTPGKKQ